MRLRDVYRKNRGIILFFVAMFVANIVWKLSVQGIETVDDVQIFGSIDVSGFFHTASIHFAKVTYFLTHAIRPNAVYTGETVINFLGSEGGVNIVWGCTGIKQMFIFVCIMLCSLGSWRRKLWFIPLGVMVCYLINVFRLVALALIVEQHREYFDLFHEYVFKYLFYGLIFLMWVLWEEKIRRFGGEKVGYEKSNSRDR